MKKKSAGMYTHAIAPVLIFTLSLLCFSLAAQPAKKAGKSRLVYDGTNYYGLFKPADSTSGIHPVIFCANGQGEQGTFNSAGGSTGAYCKAGASMQFPNTAKGGYSTFFVIEVYDWNAAGIFSKLPGAIAYAKSTLGSLLDTTQMYYMGLSLSGDVAGLIAADTAGLGKRFAGVLGCSPTYSVDGGVIFAGLAKTHLFGCWVDANNDPNNNTNWVMQSYAEFNIGGYTGTPVPKLYIPNGPANASRHSNSNYGGHSGGWYLGMDTTSQTWDLDSSKFAGHTSVTNTPVFVTNLYEQFLSYQRLATGNVNPIANAGPDKYLLLPTSTITLDGTGSSDADGTIASYNWTKLSGGTATITSPTSATTTVTGLTSGHYSFRLQVTDNGGASAYDTMALYVNQKPTASIAGNPITVTVDSVQLNGSGSTDDDGIQSYSWTKISGPGSPSIVSPSASATWVKSLSAGSYVFRLVVSDYAGAKDTAQVTVNVSSNTPPIADAGPDNYILLPTSGITLDGSSSSDPGGSISAYLWTKISGGSAAITTAGSAITTVTGLTSGHYYFQLKVTDNLGAIAYDTMHVYVNQKPSANILGNPISITLPADSVLLNGSGSTDDDGIQSYAWSKTGGPGSPSIVTPTASTTKVTGLSTAGSYTFRLIVTDWGGAKDTAQVTVNVSGSGGRIAANLPENKQATADSAALIYPVISGVYPNPARDRVTITYFSKDNSVKIISLYNTSGVLKAKYNWQVKKGNNIYQLNNTLREGGLYIIDIRDSSGKSAATLRFIKL